MNNNIYNQNPYYMGQNYNNMPMQKKPMSGMAIVSLILSIVSFIFCCLIFSVIPAIISIILALIVLIKNKGGKGLAIAGLSVSVVAVIFSIYITATMYPFIRILPEWVRDATKFVQDTELVEEFERTGELPEYFDKYYEGETGEFFEETMGGFDEFMEEFIEGYQEG